MAGSVCVRVLLWVSAAYLCTGTHPGPASTAAGRTRIRPGGGATAAGPRRGRRSPGAPTTGAARPVGPAWKGCGPCPGCVAVRLLMRLCGTAAARFHGYCVGRHAAPKGEQPCWCGALGDTAVSFPRGRRCGPGGGGASRADLGRSRTRAAGGNSPGAFCPVWARRTHPVHWLHTAAVYNPRRTDGIWPNGIGPRAGAVRRRHWHMWQSGPPSHRTATPGRRPTRAHSTVHEGRFCARYAPPRRLSHGNMATATAGTSRSAGPAGRAAAAAQGPVAAVWRSPPASSP